MSRNPLSSILARLGWSGGKLPKSFEPLLRACENTECRRQGLLRSLRVCEEDGICLHGRWYCSGECFESAATDEFGRLLVFETRSEKRTHRIPIGLLMLSRGLINDRQLKRALALQRQTGQGRIGEFLRSIDAASEQDIAVGLAAQWGCAVYPLDRARDFLQCANLLPLELLENSRMLPVHYTRATGTLHVGFIAGVDRTALYAIERMLGLRTVPCIVSESALRRAFEELQNRTKPATAVFDSALDVPEMVRTTRSYAWQLGAQDVAVTRSGPFIWVRLKAAQSSKDILFQAASVH